LSQLTSQLASGHIAATQLAAYPAFLKSPAINERNSRSVGELYHSAGESIELVLDCPDLPIAIHPKMDDEGITTVEMKQLVLSAPLDALDSLPFDGTGARRREFLPE
jgi:hypothetical protein